MKLQIHLALIVVLATFTLSAYAHGLLIPMQYKSKVSDRGNCALLTSPKSISGTEICQYRMPLSTVASETGMFENDGERWLLAGPGIPHPATSGHLGKVVLFYGVVLCSIEDSNGVHGAGGQCFYGIASNNTESITIRSNSIDLNLLKKTNFEEHKKAFFEFTKLNLQKVR